MIGGFLQENGRCAREMAQLFGAVETGLAAEATCGSLEPVVAVQPLRTGTGSLNRYPSPDGRSALPLGSPPIFYRANSGAFLHRRTLAHIGGGVGPAAGTNLHLVALHIGYVQGTHNRKGCQICRLPNGSQVPFAPLRLPLAATRRLSRVSSGRARGPVRLSCWMATLSRVPSSVARPTSSIASATPRAAEPVAGRIPRGTSLIALNHRTVSRSGGFFHV